MSTNMIHVVYLAAVLPVMSTAIAAAPSAAAGFSAEFEFAPIKGLSPGDDRIVRRDPSDIIRSDGQYYVWYTRITPDQHGYPTGYPDEVWYATSEDGHSWIERGRAIPKGQPDSWDACGVFTPNILFAKQKYYLFYTAVPDRFSNYPHGPHRNDEPPATPTAIGVAVSNSPGGPWTKSEDNPVLKPAGRYEAWDNFRVDDACLITYKGKYWLYYKGRASKPGQVWWGPTPMGVAIAENPSGPYVKSNANPLVRAGHEMLVWPHGPGVAAYAKQGGVWYSRDGLRFEQAMDTSAKPVVGAAGAYRRDAFEDDGCGVTGSLGGCATAPGRAYWGFRDSSAIFAPGADSAFDSECHKWHVIELRPC